MSTLQAAREKRDVAVRRRMRIWAVPRCSNAALAKTGKRCSAKLFRHVCAFSPPTFLLSSFQLQRGQQH